MSAPLTKKETCWCVYILMAIFVFVCMCLFGCASAPVATPQSPGFGVIGVSLDKTGFIVTPSKRDYLIANGSNPAWFSVYDDGFYISSENEAQAAELLLAKRNQ